MTPISCRSDSAGGGGGGGGVVKAGESARYSGDFGLRDTLGGDGVLEAALRGDLCFLVPN